MSEIDPMTSVQEPEPPQRRQGVRDRARNWARCWLDRRVLLLDGICVVVGLVLSLAIGWLWVTVADPPAVPLAGDGGLYLGEQALNQQSSVTLWFLVIGAAAGAVAGVLVAWFGRHLGAPVVVAVLLLCGVATLGSRYCGVHVFGPDANAAAARAQVGDLVQLDAKLDTWVAYLGWPIGGLLGALAAIAGWSRGERPRSTPPSPTLYSPSAAPAEPQHCGDQDGSRQHEPSG